MKNEGFTIVLNNAYKALGNPIVMIDTSYNLIASTENPVKDDYLWNELIEQGTFSSSTVDFFNKADFVQAVADSDCVALLSHESIKYDRACAKFFDRAGIQLGSIVVVACQRPFEESDYAIMADVCDKLSDENDKSLELHEKVFYDPIISGLIEGKNSAMYESMFKKPGEYLFIAVADTSKYEPTVSHLAYFRDVFEKLQGEHKYFIYLNSVVMVISSKEPSLDIQKQLGGLSDYFEKYGIFAGVSEGFTNVSLARVYYKQAVQALNKSLLDLGGPKIAKYSAEF